MANIVNYTKGYSYNLSPKSVNITEVNCIYDVQTLLDGSKMVVIKTFNPKSKNAGVSQTIHFTKDSALKLIEIFKQEFNI